MLTELSSQQVVNDFLNKMLTDAGMDNVSPEVREQMFTDLKNRMEERFFATVLNSLDEKQVTALRTISESGASPKEVQKFITENVPNAADLFARAMLSFREVYLGTT